MTEEKMGRRMFMVNCIFSRSPKLHIGNLVEVGVGYGRFSDFLCNAFPVKNFIGVDPYLKYEKYTDIPVGLEEFYETQEGMDLLYGITKERFNQWDNATLVRKSSIEAANDYENNFFDVVYIDANHKYEYVKQDLQAWWPKVKSGGVLCGDDYEDAGGEDFGVIQAVDEFVSENSLELNIPDCWWRQWWIAKD